MTWSQIFDKGSNLSWWLGTDKETGCFWSELVDIVHCGHGDDWLLMAAGQLFSPSLLPLSGFQGYSDSFNTTAGAGARARGSETLIRCYIMCASSLHTLGTNGTCSQVITSIINIPPAWRNLLSSETYPFMIFLVDRKRNQTRQGQAQEFGIWNLVFGLWTSSMD